VKAVEIERQLALLSETVPRIEGCMSGRSEAELRRPPQPGEWSAVQILAHLRACDGVWSHSILAMLALDQPQIPEVHPRRWARVAGYQETGFDASFLAFRLKRAEFLRVLGRLSEEDWQRSARIGGRTHTVYSQVRRMARHEAGHCDQLENLFA